MIFLCILAVTKISKDDRHSNPLIIIAFNVGEYIPYYIQLAYDNYEQSV